MNSFTPRIKVCGITRKENIRQVAALQPDYMGFIFHGPSPRDVSELIDDLPLSEIPDSIKKVAVMVNKPLEKALSIVQRYAFDTVQLHGEESPEYCRKMGRKVKVIKAFGVDENLPGNFQEYLDCVDYFLFDTLSKKRGGTGIAFNHLLLKDYTFDKPYFLAGGIAPGFKLDELIAHLAPTREGNKNLPFALDINSRFETGPGIKDLELVRQFMNRVRTEVAQATSHQKQ